MSSYSGRILRHVCHVCVCIHIHVVHRYVTELLWKLETRPDKRERDHKTTTVKTSFTFYGIPLYI